MDIPAERLDRNLRERSQETAEPGRGRIVAIRELADEGSLALVPARQVQQEVLDLLDEPATR